MEILQVNGPSFLAACLALLSMPQINTKPALFFANNYVLNGTLGGRPISISQGATLIVKSHEGSISSPGIEGYSKAHGISIPYKFVDVLPAGERTYGHSQGYADLLNNSGN